MKNHYEIKGDTAVIYLRRRDGTVVETVIDRDDLEKAKSFPNTWCAHFEPCTKSFYVYGKKESKMLRLYRFLLDVKDDEFVDHFNNDTLDNRRSNLRIVTKAQNQQNRKGATSRSKSGIRGVSWHQKNKTWLATVKINGKKKYLGSFHDPLEAEKVVVEARRKLMPYSKDAAMGGERVG